MHGLRASLADRRKDAFDIQIALPRRRLADADAFIRIENMRGMAIRFGVDRH